MGNLVTELKKEVLDANVPVSSLLRKALVLAKELNDPENEKWINSELRGYTGEAPSYRTITGVPIARDHYTGWQYIHTQNLSPEKAKMISSMNFDSPIAVLESNAKEDVLATLYDAKGERKLIAAMGGKPVIPAIQYNGSQFQIVLDIIRHKILDWVSDMPEPNPEQIIHPSPSNKTDELKYSPRGIRHYLKENKSWLFQGTGTEILKGIVALALIIGSFFVGSYITRKQVTEQAPQLASQQFQSQIDQLTQGHNARRDKLTEAIIKEQHDSSTYSMGYQERQRAIADLHKDLENEDATYQNDVKVLVDKSVKPNK